MLMVALLIGLLLLSVTLLASNVDGCVADWVVVAVRHLAPDTLVNKFQEFENRRQVLFVQLKQISGSWVITAGDMGRDHGNVELVPDIIQHSSLVDARLHLCSVYNSSGKSISLHFLSCNSCSCTGGGALLQHWMRLQISLGHHVEHLCSVCVAVPHLNFIPGHPYKHTVPLQT